MEPPEVECALSTQNESQEAENLTDISITHSSPDNKESGNTGKGSLLEENLAGDEKQGCAEFHAEQEEYSNVMTDPGMFDLDNMDETLKKRLILNGASQPKSADMPQKAFPKSKHGSHLRSFNDSWYHAKIGKETVLRNGFLILLAKILCSATFACFSVKETKRMFSHALGFQTGKMPTKSLENMRNPNVTLIPRLILSTFVHKHVSVSNCRTKLQK